MGPGFRNSLAYMDQAYVDSRAHGWSRQPVIEMLIPSTTDQTLAPAGKHVAGQVVADIIVKPGCKDGVVSVHAPQAGFVLTRRARRFIRMGDNLFKIIGDEAPVADRQGALED